MKQENLNKDK